MRIYTPTYTGLRSQPRGTEVETDSASAIADRPTPPPVAEPMTTDHTQPSLATRSERKVGLPVAVISVLMAAAAWLRTRHQHA